MAALLAVMPVARARGGEQEAALDLFEREVRPVLVETCQQCHGPKKQESELRVDSREGLLRGGSSGAAVVPGKPEESLLIAAIRQTGDYKMPPKSKLPEAKIAAIERWVKLGAPWPASSAVHDPRRDAAKTHWAFQPIVDPPAPKVDDRDAPVNPIDAFVHIKRKQAGLSGSPRASRRELIRRVTFDVTGLPPSPEEVEAFEKDNDPRAYEQLVDRLLASPHYGEQWGRHWLDVARYADTKGYVYAREQRFWVHAWVYRDWVVKALNDDLPYDRFLLLQIAADQAVNSPTGERREDLAAMGFLTLGRRFIGVTHDIIDDRIDVVTRGTMGLTAACARCHDHKYDPIPTRDYYSLYGVFQNCRETLTPISEPAARDEALVKFEKELRKRQKAYDTLFAKVRDDANARLRARVADYLVAQTEMQKYPDEGFDQILEIGDIIPASVRRWQAYLMRGAKEREPIFAAWRAYGALKPETFGAQAAAVTAELAKRSPAEVHPLVRKRFATPPSSLAEVARRYGELFAEIDGQWQTLVNEATKKKAPLPTALADAAADQLRQVLYAASGPCIVPDEPIVHTETFFDLKSCEELWKLKGKVESWLIESPSAPQYACILEDRDDPTPSYVFKRGRPANKADEAPRQFLELLSGANRQPFQHGSGRLELAKAIVDPGNPLTARVIVNRVWMHHFGAGLVKTPSDFGTRAEAPSHPELLDWLASRFIAEGWSLKKLHRRILLSETYCQSSAGPGDTTARERAVQADPGNRLLWRMNARRLSFEEMSDALLTTTGAIDLKVGGKPADMFAAGFKRRTLYGLVDRQYLPGTLRVFDFANPDLHIPQRSDTIVPQQALYFLNNERLLAAAKGLAKRTEPSATPAERVRAMVRLAYQRPATEKQVAAGLALVDSMTPVAVNGDGKSAELGPWEQLAQVLLAANEFVFVD